MSRFWAWFAYVPFSLANSLVFFSHCDGDTVLTVLLLSMIPFHLLLNGIESFLVPTTGEQPLYVPQSKILQLLVGLCLGGMLFRLLIGFRPNSTVSDQVGNFFTDMLMPWMFGSFVSQIPLVAFGSMLAGLAYVICVTPVKPRSAPVAKVSLITLLALSLFTIWVSSSDLSTVKDVAGFTAEMFVKKLLGLPIDAGISLLWIVGLFWAFSALNRERSRYSTDRKFDPNVPPLWVKLVCPALGWSSLLGAFVINMYRM